MQMPLWVSKTVGLLLALITPWLSGVLGMFTRPLDRAPAAVENNVGGFIAGVCHPEEDFDLIKGANIGWIREDIPFPYDANGNLSKSYRQWKAEMTRYVKHGIKVFAITPYPDKYLAYGLDCRTEEGLKGIQDIAVFFLEDLKDIASGFQITNEMGVDRFTEPFTLEEAARFIGVQLEAMYPLRGEKIIGYNLGGPDGVLKLPPLMKKYNQYCDYVGVDLYFGSFENIVKNINVHLAALKLIRIETGKPILMTEIGYIGYGEPKTAAEKKEILQSYGFDSEEDVRKDVDTFISRLPAPLKEEFDEYYANLSDDEKWNLLFKGEYANHIYRELSESTGIYGIPHSPEGQATYFSYLIKEMKSLSWCIGAFIYMWNDSTHCYVCGQADCPVETGWGIVDGQGNPKPAYYAVRDAFGA